MTQPSTSSEFWSATDDVVYLCPNCGSPAVEFGELVGADASCRGCKWEGRREDLVGVPFGHLLGNRDGIGFELYNDMRRLFSTPTFLVQLGGFLSRWGFIDLNEDKSVVTRSTTRYVAAVARAVLRAMIEEREKIEMESKNGR